MSPGVVSQTPGNTQSPLVLVVVTFSALNRAVSSHQPWTRPIRPWLWWCSVLTTRCALSQGQAGLVVCGLHIFGRGFILDFFFLALILGWGRSNSSTFVYSKGQHVLWAFSQPGFMSRLVHAGWAEGSGFFPFLFSSFHSFAVLSVFFNSCSCRHQTFNEHLRCASQAPAWHLETLKRFKNHRTRCSSPATFTRFWIPVSCDYFFFPVLVFFFFTEIINVLILKCENDTEVYRVKSGWSPAFLFNRIMAGCGPLHVGFPTYTSHRTHSYSFLFTKTASDLHTITYYFPPPVVDVFPW